MALSREALLIHLQDLRALETILFESRNRIEKLQSRLKNGPGVITVANPPQKPQEPEYRKLPFKDGFYYATAVGCVIVSIIFFGEFGNRMDNPYSRLFSDSSDSFWKVFFFVGAFLFIFGAIMTVSWVVGKNKYNQNLKNEHDKKLEEWNRETRKYESELAQTQSHNRVARDKFQREKDSVVEMVAALAADIREWVQLQQGAYSADIVPVQLRNIEGVYYLYDFLSTSDLSLSDALLHANISEIRKNLTPAIETTKEQVIRQAEYNAGQQEVQSRNRKILESGQASEENELVITQYARIIATNSEVSERLRKGDFAYRKADALESSGLHA